MTGKEEIVKKGYMEGKHVKGQNKAHKCCRPHTDVFNCEMFGTFNVKLKSGTIDEFQPSIVTEKANYYFLSLRKGRHTYFGWAIRDHTSNQGTSVLEVITKERLSDIFTKESFAVVIYEKWDEAQIQGWAKNQYWFQTFPFSSKKRADSEMLWNKINIVSWKGMKVIDIGSHYGYFSFKASELGAIVTGFEPNKESFRCACEIRGNIIQQDINFVRNDPGKVFDITMYLSVHHQIDPGYIKLENRIKQLKNRTKKHLFVELILPPMFPHNRTCTEQQVDEMVKMRTICTYKHAVRGMRRVYVWNYGEEI